MSHGTVNIDSEDKGEISRSPSKFNMAKTPGDEPFNFEHALRTVLKRWVRMAAFCLVNADGLVQKDVKQMTPNPES